ncbi:hypothetical protein TGGT1_215328 [Toxoplasma gondii GT1]|uniref:Transmembrane protein n=11 Tax=Toxoplasma gondii TaxID=5811 RepID=A0A125YRH7_TOXGV|nr:hypothetical protein TGGT1_215328 [Toxoplasma gondii GT1]ESS31231.1 putative transmembrane protein [Toxoplasma gondii VEG]KAF4640007.1 hypothetical protein TGRH88_039320 [Toxoplasma gondii]KFG41349.1 putative transmembrane protein [Toxoplasma gondii p89]KFG52841.1 putative transmembrane protein [Toxoplasma gondii FOU]KFH07984.1 putative transmembrane protein [Toxoplasma gondii VAND]KFH16522.1 putative transmembrane protein [Toxoplasma gondii MAS]PIL99170.1 putative transmembrane protein [
MRAWALIAAATAEVSAVAGLATLRGVWMKEINGGTTVHLGLAASLHALLQVFGAALLPVIMLRSSFTTATRLFLFLHASFLLILASCVGTDLPSFYLTHALTGLVSCAAETLLNWTLLTSRDPNEQLEDFANFHKVYDVGTLLGAGVCATVFITYELWVYNMTGTGTANCSSQLGIRAVLGVHGIIMMLSFIGQFSAPVPSIRGYTYEDLMDALNLSKNLEEKAATEDEIEKTNEQEKRRVSLHAGMPILKVEDGKTIARHPTGRFQPQPTTSGVRPVADRTIFDRDNEDEYDYTDSYGEDDDSLDDNRYFSSSTDGLSQASVRSDPVSMGSSDHTSCHSSWTPRECAVNATKFDGGQERMHCPAAEACSLPLASSPVTEDVELVYDYSRDYTENNIPKTDTAEGVGPIEAVLVLPPSYKEIMKQTANTRKLSDRLDMKLKREKRNRLGPPVCFRRNGPSLVSGLTISKYGGLKQAPLEFKAHDEKRKERAEIRGGKDLHLFYYSFSANAHICFTTKEVTERVGNIWIERHMITIPQLDFLPLKSYNKEMLTDDALKSSVAVVRETRAALSDASSFLSSFPHLLESLFGIVHKIGVLFAMGFTTDRATVVTLMLICCGGAGMSMPAGVKAGTKMVPVMMQLQQFDSQLCSAHIVRILSPTITGCLYHWDRTAPFIVSGTISELT